MWQVGVVQRGIHGFRGKNLSDRDNLKNIGIDERTILKYALKK
jgi:hypothetical protein